MKNVYNNKFCRGGYSLAEVLVALTIGSMVMVAVLGIYGRTQRSAGAIERQLSEGQMCREILQRIAEDLDRIITPDKDTRIMVMNKFENGFTTAHLSIAKAVNAGDNRVTTFERVIWQANFDPESSKDGLVMYRKFHGLVSEDRLLNKDKEQWERELFVPLCDGVTYFSIQVPDGNDMLLNEWTVDRLPTAVVVTVSLGMPFKTVAGTFDVAFEEKVTRTIAIDRSRKMTISIPEIDPNAFDVNDLDANDLDANDIDANDIIVPDPNDNTR